MKQIRLTLLKKINHEIEDTRREENIICAEMKYRVRMEMAKETLRSSGILLHKVSKL